MKKIKRADLIESIKNLCKEANYYLDKNILKKIEELKEKEDKAISLEVLKQIEENALIAEKKNLPLCQDTGTVVVFLEIGNILIDFNIEEAINKGVSLAYNENYFRKSIVNHPLERTNTLDNTPAIIHTKFTNTNCLKIKLALKGGGSENMSKIKMLTPTAGYEQVKNFVLAVVKEAGGKACPPFIIGVGIGGNFEKSALLAKESLLRDIKDSSEIAIDKKLETELFAEINKLNIGPMGFGGQTTALAVKVNSYPCHIASFPVAVNIQCHCARHKEIIL